MVLSPLAKHAKDKKGYDILKKWVDVHNGLVEPISRPNKEPEIDITLDTKAIDKAIQDALKKSLDKAFK